LFKKDLKTKKIKPSSSPSFPAAAQPSRAAHQSRRPIPLSPLTLFLSPKCSGRSAQTSSYRPINFPRPTFSSPSLPVTDRWDPPVRCVSHLWPPPSPGHGRPAPPSCRPPRPLAPLPLPTERGIQCASARRRTAPPPLPETAAPPAPPPFMAAAGHCARATASTPPPLPFLRPIKVGQLSRITPHPSPLLLPRSNHTAAGAPPVAASRRRRSPTPPRLPPLQVPR
jgi:hypothetical protein